MARKDDFESEDAPANPFEVKGLSTSRYEEIEVQDSGGPDVCDRSPITPYSGGKNSDRD